MLKPFYVGQVIINFQIFEKFVPRCLFLIFIYFLVIVKYSKRTTINDKSLTALTLHAFSQCEYDGLEGLSWDEIQVCEDNFCHMLTIACPTKDNFNAFDVDRNGILTMEEYRNQIRN